jgi:hypothetical protein
LSPKSERPPLKSFDGVAIIGTIPTAATPVVCATKSFVISLRPKQFKVWSTDHAAQITIVHFPYSARNNGGRSENRCIDALTGRMDMERVSARIVLQLTPDGIVFVREEIFSVRPGVPCMQYLHHVLIVLKFMECDCCTLPFSAGGLWGSGRYIDLCHMQRREKWSKPGAGF